MDRRRTPDPTALDAARLGRLRADQDSPRDVREGDHALWQLTVEHSPVGMCLVNLEGDLVMPNRAFAEMIGYTQAEVRGLTFQELTHPDDLGEDVALFEQALRGERTSYRLVKRYLHADGSVVWGDLSVALMRASDGTPLHFISQVLDVTTQRQDRERLAQAMAAVERERSLSQAVLDTVDVGLVLVDRDGGAERVNRRQLAILAMADPDGLLSSTGHNGHFYAADGTTPLTVDQMPTMRAVCGEEFDDDRVWVGPDRASRRALSVSARTVRDAAGEAVGAALAFSDVTDLVTALQAREVFESSVSHELRTPLTSVLGHLELVLDDPGLSEAATRQLRVAQRNATRLQYLVSDLLDPAARGLGTLELLRAPTDVAALVRDVVATGSAEARAAQIAVVAHADDCVRAVVDVHRVHQVLDNLVSNAVKYTDPGGSVDVTVEADEDEVTLSVTDTGIGIAPDDLERLFEPFFRADHARERVAPGVGLGLGIARSIVVAHGGRLEVDSTPGAGSTFCVVLPRGDHAVRDLRPDH
ncbi:Alkaline phosphatase synthesis sensor protein PhoR [Nocardioides aquaticus]|uniref:histidine kinase n=1 Tax=Nocardioides aquaticus TaxID=160826 RepID=A0ABX8EES4_9ACTN|nr:HAMP domain-containing sensor histidine kinase [Nocardioides aquaticus]QVT78385.1 Alkaline phosphatase synthesis sensor protein PhoR [Nocardioides aquaticus]